MKPKTLLSLLMPAAIGIFVIFIIYVPRLLITPYDEFLISSSEPFCHSGTYSVVQQQLVFTPNSKNADYCDKPKNPQLFRYRLAQKQFIAVDADEAKKLTFDGSLTSSQGLSVTNNYHSHDLLTDMLLYNHPGYYLMGRGYSEKLNVPTTTGASTIQFIGWIRHDQ